MSSNVFQLVFQHQDFLHGSTLTIWEVSLSSNVFIEDRVLRKSQFYGYVLLRSTRNGIAKLSWRFPTISLLWRLAYYSDFEKLCSILGVEVHGSCITLVVGVNAFLFDGQKPLSLGSRTRISDLYNLFRILSAMTVLYLANYIWVRELCPHHSCPPLFGYLKATAIPPGCIRALRTDRTLSLPKNTVAGYVSQAQ